MVFFVAFGAMGLGALLILLIAAYGKHPQAQPAGVPSPGGPAMPYDDFRSLLIDLFEVLGLDVVHISGSRGEIDFIARTRTALIAGKYIIHAHVNPPGDVVTQAQVLRLQDQVRGEGASKGILITPFRIDAQGLAALEVEIELVDGRKLRGLLEQHLPKRVDEVARYRGFGL
jgi:hypothetical protein